MTPWKDGKANEGHSCVKGRFAWGYATHADRITRPMIRKKISDPWTFVTWDEAIDHAAGEFKRIQATYGRDSVGGITSSRCTNEETYLVQKLVRAAFGNNNVDTCARVCHSPTGYGLGQTYGTSAGTQTFASVDHCDVMIVIGANPTDAHPVFASRMKKRLARGREADRRRSAPDRSGRVGPRRGGHPPALRPGTNVAIITALAHVVVTEGLVDEAYVAERCDPRASSSGAHSSPGRRTRPRHSRPSTGVPAVDVATRGAALCHRRQWRDLLRPRRHRARPGFDDGDGHRQSRDGHGQRRSRRRRRQSAARPEQCPGQLRHGLVPARAARLPPHLRRGHARACSTSTGA